MRQRIRGLVSAIVVVLVATVLAPVSAVPTADLATVERQVEKLQMEAATAAEDWNEARTQLESINQKIRSLRDRAATQNADRAVINSDLTVIIRDLYKSGGMDLDIQAMLASDPTTFLAHLDAINIVGTRQEATVRKLQAASLTLSNTKAALETEKVKAQKLAAKANSHLKTVKAKLAEAERLLGSLQLADRKKRAAKIAAQKKAQAAKAKKEKNKVTAKVTSARLRKVLNYALAQVGDRYNTGGTGPSSYDCSGLTMMAYRQIGVNLSHFSGSQWSQTRRVSRSQLRAGDLIFFFKGIRHVAMYIGGGKMVHAANYGKGVIISSIYESYYVSRVSGYGRVIG